MFKARCIYYLLCVREWGDRERKEGGEKREREREREKGRRRKRERERKREEGGERERERGLPFDLYSPLR